MNCLWCRLAFSGLDMGLRAILGESWPRSGGSCERGGIGLSGTSESSRVCGPMPRPGGTIRKENGSAMERSTRGEGEGMGKRGLGRAAGGVFVKEEEGLESLRFTPFLAHRCSPCPPSLRLTLSLSLGLLVKAKQIVSPKTSVPTRKRSTEDKHCPIWSCFQLMNPDLLSDPSASYPLEAPASNGTSSPTVPYDHSLLLLTRYYHYDPALWPACVALVAYFLMTILLTCLTIKYRGHYMWIIVGTAFAETVGYALRILMMKQPSLVHYIVTTFFLLLPPIALAFVNYYVLGRVLQRYGRRILLLKPQYVAVVFLVSDVLTFLLQAGGGGLMASSSTTMRNAGMDTAIFGLVVQLVFFLGFAYLTLHSSFISARYRLYRVHRLRPVYLGLWITIGILFIRNIYRTCEFSVSDTSYLTTNEWPFYLFDSICIYAALITYAILHFGRLIPIAGDWEKDVERHLAEVKAKEVLLVSKALPEEDNSDDIERNATISIATSTINGPRDSASDSEEEYPL